MLEFINVAAIPTFLLVFARVLAFLVTLPLFSYRTIPTMIKISMAFFVSLIILTTLGDTSVVFEVNYLVLLAKELTIGILTGLIAYIILAALQIAGGFIDFQMGFAVANVIDPQTGAQSPLIGQYFYMFALLFLLAVNGHHLLIEGIINSYTLIPLDGFISFGDLFSAFTITSFNKMFLIAFQMAIPLVGCLFLVDVALGIVARAVPQLNVFVVGLPLKITVSFTVLLLFFSFYIPLVKYLFSVMFETMRELMLILGGT